MYNEFIDFLSQQFSKGLPGQDAQYKMVPSGRERTRLENIEYRNPKRAAVLLLLYPENEVPHIVLTKRNKYPGVHSDQISFPGGKFEERDESMMETALRESKEEIGVHPGLVNVLGELTQVFIPPSNFLVDPYVGFLDEKPIFTPEEKEVTEIIEFSVEDLLNPDTLGSRELDVRGEKVKVPAYIVQKHVVWGATAMILSEFSHLINR